MKKLFTTLLMMGVALCGWATISETSDGTTVTLNYVDDGNQNDQNFSLSNRNATTIVLTGDWANKDLQTIGKIVGQCNGNVFLDMSDCSNMVSKVDTSAENIDWTSDNLRFVYSNAAPVSQDVQKEGKWIKPDGSVAVLYSDPQQDSGGYYYWDNGNKVYLVYQEIWGYYSNYYSPGNPDPTSWVTVDTNSVTVNPNNPNQGTATVTPTGVKFSMAGNDFSNQASKLSGIAFPNHANFTAIPDQVFGEKGPENLASVTLGSNLLYIGKQAFKLTKVTSVNFPSGLKVIGPEAFDYTPLTSINLQGCISLVKIGYEAFEGCKQTTSITFPATSTLTFIGNDAFQYCELVEEINMEMCTGITEFQHNGGDYKTFAECKALKRVILPPNLRDLPEDNGSAEGVFHASKNIEYLKFTGTGDYDDCELQNPLSIGDYAFAECNNLATIILSNNVSYVGIEAFSYAAITTIHIPASVEILKKHAFIGCQQLTTVVFDEFDKNLGDCDGAKTILEGGMGIGGQGHGVFQTCQHITDVYINTNAELQCTNNAFDQLISWGAGNTEGNFATLHFPKDKAEHYVNLSHYLTDEIVKDPGKFHDWLMEHYNQAANPYKNGWYEFINSGPTTPEDGPEYQEIILRTFSDHDFSYLVPNGIRAYVVNNVEKVNGNYQLTVQRLNVIPANTGVILYGHPNGKTQGGKRALVMTPVQFVHHGDTIWTTNQAGERVMKEIWDGPDQGAAFCRANWDLLGEDEQMYKNYLEPSFDENGEAIRIEPFEYDQTKTKVAWRNFGMNRYNTTRSLHNVRALDLETGEHDYVGFFRVLPKTHPVGYAYLRLAGDAYDNGNDRPAAEIEYTDAEGLEVVVLEDPDFFMEYRVTTGEMFNPRTNASLNPKGWWDLDHNPKFDWTEWTLSWGIRPTRFKTDPNAAPKFLGELEDADGIVNVVVPAGNQDGEYYTLQGVRVANPTKGVYILNGKKVIIK